MKLRMGFVSNSSTSSFVMLGVRMTLDDVKDLMRPVFFAAASNQGDDYSDDDFWEWIDNSDWYYQENWFGKYITGGSSDSDLISESETGSVVLIRMITEIVKFTNRPPEDVRLVTGVYAS